MPGFEPATALPTAPQPRPYETLQLGRKVFKIIDDQSFFSFSFFLPNPRTSVQLVLSFFPLSPYAAAEIRTHVSQSCTDPGPLKDATTTELLGAASLLS